MTRLGDLLSFGRLVEVDCDINFGQICLKLFLQQKHHFFQVKSALTIYGKILGYFLLKKQLVTLIVAFWNEMNFLKNAASRLRKKRKLKLGDAKNKQISF